MAKKKSPFMAVIFLDVGHISFLKLGLRYRTETVIIVRDTIALIWAVYFK
jgi:hypothetical protein